MSSFGALIVASILMVLTISIMLYVPLTLQYINDVSERNLEAMSLKLAMQSTKIVIYDVNLLGEASIYLKAKNVGSNSIFASKFPLIDIFVLGVLKNDTSPIVIRVDFDQKHESDEGWSVLSVSTNDINGEIINPLDLKHMAYGAWDPGEELLLYIRLSDLHALNTSYPVSIIMISPDGNIAERIG